MSYRQAETYLLGTINETVSRRLPYRLERMKAFMRELGDPQNVYPTVHIGGTSGKGSTSTMVATVLQSSGKRVGLHTKPHLRSMTERARVDGVPVDEERFAELLDSMMPAIDRVAKAHGRPTYYETLLALAFKHFAEEHVDVAVIEVGLGGRLDGTNVIVPRVAAITSVGYDHMDVLGDALEDIAAEKAGIAKPGVPLVVAVDDAAARSVVIENANAAHAPVTLVDDAATVDVHPSARFGQHFTITTAQGRYDLAVPVLGEFQRRNAMTAVLALERIGDDLRPSVENVERGFANLAIAGRMETFPGHPAVIFDIAHNAEKAQHLVMSLRESFPDRHVTYVVAIGQSKDAGEILRALASLPSNFIFTTFATAGRAATKPQRLASIAETIGAWGRAVADPIEALTIARRNAGPDDIVVVTGSTFIVAELRAWWLENVGDARPSRT